MHSLLPLLTLLSLLTTIFAHPQTIALNPLASIHKRQAQCVSLCMSDSDVAALQTFAGCSDSDLTSGTGTDKPTAPPSSSPAPSTLLPQTSTYSPPNITLCDSSCSSPSDQTASKDALTCQSGDPTCLCNGLKSSYEALCAYALTSTLTTQPTASATSSPSSDTGTSTVVVGNGQPTGGGGGGTSAARGGVGLGEGAVVAWAVVGLALGVGIAL
ncbi:hypothetical protein DACRYDRAFT_12772 [Dacryopinax primogenitus]|uniref:Extracellular membrane protein CFEM domain-containing protein n=1 Tax=Dacryopinax primogenitus (strain DJM 731) TaxID=1858805 RepID=M5GGR4_DACPD|nr:uncharacterized protein DACRYDRAFT_12772 [Dacryopinax primogenitus]EJU05943.1 hypothetical protein DACRYDRAFT_12772 [Dacryopinax primogenitus]